MNEILVVHPKPEEVKSLARMLKPGQYSVMFARTFAENITYIKNHESLLVFLSSALEEEDCLDCLKKNKKILRNNVMIINFGRSMDYILECLANGAVHFFDMNFNDHQLRTLVQLHFKKNLSQDRYNYLLRNIVSEKKELVLTNFDIYNSDRIDMILDYLTASIRPLFDKETYIGISNAVYEILVNAMEHGNLGIDGAMKEDLLEKGEYGDFLLKKLKGNTSKVTLRYINGQNVVRIIVADEGKGFELKSNDERRKNVMALSGRGIPIAKFYFDKVSFNKKGNIVTLTKLIDTKNSGVEN